MQHAMQHKPKQRCGRTDERTPARSAIDNDQEKGKHRKEAKQSKHAPNIFHTLSPNHVLEAEKTRTRGISEFGRKEQEEY